MTGKDQDSLVTAQFGPRASAYVNSSTHAQGEDLTALAAMVAGSGVESVLDLGCGGGHVAFAVAPYVKNVVAYDLSQDMLDAVAIEAARRSHLNISIRQGAVEQLPFDGASFDFVITRLSAHHWRDLAAALKEARRVVKPRGRAVFIDSQSPGTPKLDTFLQAVELFRDPSHVRNYSEAEWRAALSAAGFAVTRVTQYRLPIAFQPWIERMRTPPAQADAIRAVEKRMPKEVIEHFAIEPDGSYVLDIGMIETVPADRV